MNLVIGICLAYFFCIFLSFKRYCKVRRVVALGVVLWNNNQNKTWCSLYLFYQTYLVMWLSCLEIETSPSIGICFICWYLNDVFEPTVFIERHKYKFQFVSYIARIVFDLEKKIQALSETKWIFPKKGSRKFSWRGNRTTETHTVHVTLPLLTPLTVIIDFCFIPFWRKWNSNTACMLTYYMFQIPMNFCPPEIRNVYLWCIFCGSIFEKKEAPCPLPNAAWWCGCRIGDLFDFRWIDSTM